ncbi:MAG: hypothetical protein JXB45_08660 [Candidatus Krumholzibacteriota bacterium]|nr:hypothetical protein [Candidatus Krumholzibacteriota bacterium]
MKNASWTLMIIMMICASTLWAGDFKVYPDAKLDEKLTKEALEMSAGAPGADQWKIAIYTTKDSYEKVCAFYKKIGNEYHMPSAPESMKLPSGTEVKSLYFLFGGAEDLVNAKSWIKVQNPLIGHKAVMIMKPGLKDEDIGVVKGVTTILHMLQK